MKKVINGKMYNTDTAREVGCTSGGGQSFRDFGYWLERLYCKRTGEYFLYGHGGARTRYAEQVGNMWCDGEKITPLSYAEAREWAEKNMDADDYQKEFGEVAEDDSTTVVSLSMPAGVVDKARRAAQEAGVSLSAYIAGLIG